MELSLSAIKGLLQQELYQFQSEIKAEIKKLSDKIERAMSSSGQQVPKMLNNSNLNKDKEIAKLGYQSVVILNPSSDVNYNQILDFTEFFNDLDVPDLSLASSSFEKVGTACASSVITTTNSLSDTSSSVTTSSNSCCTVAELPKLVENKKSNSDNSEDYSDDELIKEIPEVLVNQTNTTETDEVSVKNKKETPDKKPSLSDLALTCKIATIFDKATGLKMYECPFCNKLFKLLKDMYRHLMIHTDHRPFVCEVCNKAFKRASHLRVHLQIHTGERPYKCEKCPKTFCGYSALKRHQLVHERQEQKDKKVPAEKDYDVAISGTRERPYVCGICDRRFKQKSHRNLHFNTFHLQEKKFMCSICDKAFARKEHLARHTRSHTGERPYKCPKCPMSFSDSSTLCKHKRSKHDM